jgi:hypothetical protein
MPEGHHRLAMLAGRRSMEAVARARSPTVSGGFVESMRARSAVRRACADLAKRHASFGPWQATVNGTFVVDIPDVVGAVSW